MARQAGSFVVIAGIAAAFGSPLAAAPRGAPAEGRKTVVVATKVAPPFAMKAADGDWSGISIDLWNAIAAEPALNFETEFLETRTVAELLDAVRTGRADAGIAAVTVNEQ